MPSGSGIRYLNGLMELRGKGMDLELTREQTAMRLKCKPYEIPKKRSQRSSAARNVNRAHGLDSLLARERRIDVDVLPRLRPDRMRHVRAAPTDARTLSSSRWYVMRNGAYAIDELRHPVEQRRALG